MVDEIYSNLNGDSVHLSNWPIQEEGALPPQDLELESRMELVRSLAETGRRIRVKAKRRQRLPCNEGWIVGGPDLDVFHEILAEELNVEKISTVNDLDKFQQIELSPNRKMLGKKCRQDLPSVLEAISSSDPESTWQEIQSGTCKLAGYEITAEDIELRRVERSGFAAETIKFSENDEDLDVSLVLDMQISPELASKGLARDIIRRIQQKRKDLELDIEENIELTVWLDQGNPELLENDWAHLQNETRAR
jgi:Isoleucyl-tRNA synthetase